MNRHGGLEENASLVAACVVLGFYLFVSGISSAYPKNFYYIEAVSFALPINAFLSVRAIVWRVSKCLPAAGWWLRGLLRWSSLGIGYAFIVFCIVGFTESINPAMSDFLCWLRHAHADRSLDASYITTPVALFIALATGTPLAVLIRQAMHDYDSARRRFGSITQAERTLHFPETTRSKRDFQP